MGRLGLPILLPISRCTDYADLIDDTSNISLNFTTQAEQDTHIHNIESDMREAARNFEFEKAAKLRDAVKRASHERVSIQLGLRSEGDIVIINVIETAKPFA